MENVKPAVYLMKFQCPEQSADSRIGIAVQEQMLLSLQKLWNAVCFPDVKRMVIVGIIGCDKIVPAVPFSDTGIRPIGRDWEFVMLLMYPSGNFVVSFLPEIHLRQIPVDFL